MKIISVLFGILLTVNYSYSSNPKNSSEILSSENVSLSLGEIDLKKFGNETFGARLECMDFRFVKREQEVMDGRGLSNKNDLLVYAGSSLAFLEKDGWEYIKKHLHLAIDFHKIQAFSIIDHEDCGAYEKKYGDKANNHKYEKELHIKNLKIAKEKINKEFPNLKVELLYIKTNGQVETLE